MKARWWRLDWHKSESLHALVGPDRAKTRYQVPSPRCLGRGEQGSDVRLQGLILSRIANYALVHSF